MASDYLPPFSLREELVMVLALHAVRSERGDLPVLPPRGILENLNEFGPPVAERWLPMIEATLDGLWAEGHVGRIPAPTPYHAKAYCSRSAAMRAIEDGVPVILLPRRGEFDGDRSASDREDARDAANPQLTLLGG